MKSVDVNGKTILLTNLRDEYYAIGDKCTHRNCKLSKGTLNGDVVKCPCHGSRFNVKTGEALGGPAVKPEPKYEIKIEDNQIQIRLQ